MSNGFTDKFYGVKSKNVGPFLAFGDAWFMKHQAILIHLLNFPIIKLWTRWVFRIHRDCKYSDFIIQIEPNNYKVLLPDGQIRGDFRTHPKFSKRVYFAFRWWWWVLHYCDELFKVVELSPAFGFDELTAYPLAGANAPADGDIYRGVVNETFANIVSGAGQTVRMTGTTFDDYLQASSTTNQFQYLVRSALLFTTSSIGSGAISAAVLSIYGDATGSGNGFGSTPSTVICGFTTSNNAQFATGDFSNFGSVSFSSILASLWNTAGYNDFSLNANGISNIDKSGTSKFGRRNSWDFSGAFDGVWFSGQTYSTKGRSADYSGTNSDPKLVVTYSSTAIKTINGVAIASVKSYNGILKANILKAIGVA